VTTPTATTGSSTNPPTSTEGTLGLEFRLDRTFTPDLADKSTSAFQNLAMNVTGEV